MARMKTFFLYALIVIAFIFFSDFFCFAAIKTTYTDFDRQVVATKTIKPSITEAKKTYMNGYIEGQIENTTTGIVTDKFLKFEFFSKQGNSLGAKYIRIEDMKPGEKRDFEVSYHIRETVSYRVTEINADEAGDIPEEEFSMDPRRVSLIYLVGGLLMLYFL